MIPAPKPEILAAFEASKGFMPMGEGLALYSAAVAAGRLGLPSWRSAPTAAAPPSCSPTPPARPG